MTEHEMQKKLLEWCKESSVEYPGLNRIVHIANEGKRGGKKIGAMRSKGPNNKGFPDLFLPFPSNEYHGLFIELKTKTGKLSDDQKGWLCYLSGMGYRATVCRSLEAAQGEIVGYYEGLV